MNGRPRSPARDGGQSTVELAIILPILLTLLIGIVDVAVGINAYATVTDASREAASYAILHPTASPAAIESAATSRTAPLANVTVTTTYRDPTSGTWNTWTTGLPAHTPAATAIPVRVDVSYSWSTSTILIGQFFRSSPVTFHGISTMVATW